MTGLFSLTYGNVAMAALIVCGIAALTTLAGRVVWYRIRVALDDHYYPPRPELLDEYADHARLADEVGVRGDRTEVAPEDEPSWPGKAPHQPPTRHLFALAEQAVVFGDNPARFDMTGYHSTSGVISTPPETAAETSGRHALIQGDDTATGLMPAVVDDDGAMAVLAVVSGGDGAT